MPIDVTCNCGAKLSFRDDQAGKLTRCPTCGDDLLVPRPKSPQSPKPPSPQKPPDGRM